MENREIERAKELLRNTTQEEQLAILKVLSPLINVITYVGDQSYRVDNVLDVNIVPGHALMMLQNSMKKQGLLRNVRFVIIGLKRI